MPAPVASGGSDRPVGLAPTGKAPPCHGARRKQTFIAPRGGQSAKSQAPPAAPTAVSDQPIAPVRIGPNATYRSPSKRLIWACLIGAKFVGLVLIVMPGSSIGSSR